MNYKRIHVLLFGSCLLIPCYGQVLLNTGRMHIAQGDNPVSMYIGGDYVHRGDEVSVVQKGSTLLTGDFVNEATSGHIFSVAAGDSTLIFGGTGKQYIRGGAGKAASVSSVQFPNIRVSNPAGVWVADSMRIQVQKLFLPGGKLVLESDTVTGKRESSTAQLLVKDAVYYNRNTATPDDPNQGIVQVDLALGNNYKGKKLIGFSSPFKTLYADYFTYNFLSKPSPAGLFGDTGMLIEDLRTPLRAGEGYIVGQGIINDEQYYSDQLDPQWQGAKFTDRATTQFSFARNLLPESLGQFLTDAKYFQDEELNTGNVTVALNKQGFHYVGNPFTCAIDMSGFLAETNDSANDWGVTRSADGTAEMRNNFYVMSGGTGEFFPNNTYGRFKFSVSYLVGQSVGGTVSIDPNTPYIAPMQMFIVGKNSSGAVSNFVIPATARSIDKQVGFLRSTPQNNVNNEILLQITDEDSKAYDRLCVVFREGATLNATDKYDAGKLFNYSKGVSQIYTRSADNKNMTTNVVSPQTQSLPLFLDPCSEAKTATISAHRLESLQAVSYLFLEDKKTEETVDLLQNPSYSFTTTPEDNSERFVLHFTMLTDVETNTVATPQVYYADGTLYIKGLTQADEGSRLTLSNMQGSPVHRSKIARIPDMQVPLSLPEGVYIARVAGKNNHTLKIITQ